MPHGATITEVSIRSNPNYIERIRKIIGCMADHVGMTGKECYDTKLAVTEACANAIRHGSPDQQKDRITIRLSSTREAVVAEISDPGEGFDPAALTLAHEPHPGGHGIPLMKALMDELDFQKNPTGTTVRLVKRVKTPKRHRLIRRPRQI